MLRIGLLTGGGDAPGLNGIIEATAKTLLRSNVEVIGILDGFEGIFQNQTKRIQWSDLDGLHAQAGTYLGTSNQTKIEGNEALFQSQLSHLALDGLIVAGGDGTFLALKRLAPNAKMIGVPKTIDNDLQGTDVTFGYDTACTVIAEAVDSLRATAEAHRRVIVVETMGRTAGWLALGGGLASYADGILIAEKPYSQARLKAFLNQQKSDGRKGLILVASEGAHAEGEGEKTVGTCQGGTDSKRYGGIGESLSAWIEGNTEWKARHVVLGPLQRSRGPTVYDRMLTLNLGQKAAELALAGKFETAVVVRSGECVVVPLATIQGSPRRIDEGHAWLKLAENLGIFV
jgi:ATP-dependent phosphofructokinase / diphosphate-dependent phosphofructokinase